MHRGWVRYLIGCDQPAIRRLRRLEFLGDLVIDLSGLVMDLEAPAASAELQGTAAEGVSKRLRLLRDRTLAEMKSVAADDQPYSAMALAWLETFRSRIIGGAL